jgi:hypothetical protein
MASLAAFGSVTGVAKHKILYVSFVLLGLVQHGRADPFPTTLPTETTSISGPDSGYTGTLPTQVSIGVLIVYLWMQQFQPD